MATLADLHNVSMRLKGYLENNDTFINTSSERLITDCILTINEYIEKNMDDGK